ncbi:MAG: hypothetical protein K8U03_09200 [Planctomycetia bacterium]|nr:hypothetical protein [Planctomycetia bacterium]
MAVNVPRIRPPQLIEDVASRRIVGGATPSAEVVWNILGTADHALAETLLIEATPLIFPTAFHNLVRKDWSCDPDGRRKWRGSVQYGVPDPDDNQEQMSFNVSGETTHITQALRTIGKFRASDSIVDPADFQGAIGVDKDGEVKGVDIVTGKLSFSKTVYFPLNRVNDLYLKTLAGLVGKVNETQFKTFAPGEVLFVGCSGSPQWEKSRWEITFNFDCSPNLTNIQIGPIVVDAKLGWDYLWVQYEKFEDGAAKQIVPRPLQVNVERVYYFADFAALGIGN